MWKVDLFRVFNSVGFWIAVSGIILMGIISGSDYLFVVHSEAGGGVWPEFLEGLFYTVTSDLFLMMIPIFATLSFSPVFIEEYSNRSIRYLLCRTTRGKYYISKTLSVAVSGAAPVLIGVMVLYSVFLVVLSQDNNSGRDYSFQYYVFFAELIILILNGAIWAILGAVFSVLTKNKYIAFAAPFIVYYILSVFQARYYPEYLILNPTEIMRSPLYMGRCEPGLIVSGILLIIVALLYILQLRNKVKNV